MCFLSAASKVKWSCMESVWCAPQPARSSQAWRSVHFRVLSVVASHVWFDELMPLGPAPGWPVPESRVSNVWLLHLLWARDWPSKCPAKLPLMASYLTFICRLPLLPKSARSLHPLGEHAVCRSCYRCPFSCCMVCKPGCSSDFSQVHFLFLTAGSSTCRTLMSCSIPAQGTDRPGGPRQAGFMFWRLWGSLSCSGSWGLPQLMSPVVAVHQEPL